MYCTKCGNQMSEEEKFCSSCGTAVEETVNSDTSETEPKRKNNSTRNIAIIIGVLAVFLFFVFAFTGGDPISDIKDSTLPEYSEEITIGEAFENFFYSPNWSSYETNDTDVVVFNGYFNTNSGDEIKITIKMTNYEDMLSWEEIVLYNIDNGNTTYLNDSELNSLLNAVYENGTFSWNW